MRINQTTILIGIFGIVFIFFFGVSSIITIQQPDIVSVENNQIENEPVSTITSIVEESTTTTTITTLPLLQETEQDFILPDSDGANIETSEIAIFASDDELEKNKFIPEINLNEGCRLTSAEDNGLLWNTPQAINAYNSDFFNFSLSVQSEVALDVNCLANLISTILNDQRGWRSVEDKPFHIVDESDADFNIIFATPNIVDELCYPLQTNGYYSCRNGNNVVINYFRWMSGAEDFGTDLATYRLYLINHEVGHFLGWGHVGCPAQGALAPLMMQQSVTTNGCIPNGWPLYERLNSIYQIFND